MGDNNKHKEVGLGTMIIDLLGCGLLKISTILYVPSFKNNLLSVCKMAKKKLKIVFDDQCVIKKNDDVIAEGVKENDLYKFSGTYEHGLITGNSSNTLWYDCYGHLNYNNLQLLKKL